MSVAFYDESLSDPHRNQNTISASCPQYFIRGDSDFDNITPAIKLRKKYALNNGNEPQRALPRISVVRK